ncbi:Translational activator GCN1 [Mizuhopecten yessoensis]|uniref:Translational activator GCN1 n=1 Tax=Mizuhopecten yessoensis TaxID=6573 RepID=A0A210PDM7_MIZYE|nr:Translational activator GCN1 [Mizuhopecten yessoensis]
MTVKSRVVMPYLVPQLVTPPVNTQALSLLSSVAGDSLTKHLPRILPALMDTLSEKAGTPEEAQVSQSFESPYSYIPRNAEFQMKTR